MKILLNEPYIGSKYKNLLLEDISEQFKDKFKNLLVKKVPLMVPDLSTANRRTYPRGLCETIKEILDDQIETNSAVGELDHPIERTNIELKNIAIKILEVFWGTGLVEEKNTDVLYGIVQILDKSPSGAILSALSNAGVAWGCSSRGLGTVNDSGTVDEDDYEFICLDAVEGPSIGLLAESKKYGISSEQLSKDLTKLTFLSYDL